MYFTDGGYYQHLQHMGLGMGTTSSGVGTTATANSIADWMAAAQRANDANEVVSSGAAGFPVIEFRFILAFPDDDYTDRLEMHQHYPMLIPASGVTPSIFGVFSDGEEATARMAADKHRVHLMYNIRIRGQEEICKLLEFCAENRMLIHP